MFILEINPTNFSHALTFWQTNRTKCTPVMFIPKTNPTNFSYVLTF